MWIRFGLGRWTVLAFATVALLSVPVAVVAAGLVGPAGATWDHMTSTVLPGYVWTTAALVLAVAALTLIVGVGTAWLVAACDFPGRSFFSWALVLPLAVPAWVAAYTYAGIFDVTGPAQRVVRALVPGLRDAFLQWHIMGVEGVTVVFALVLYPYVYLIARTAFERQSRSALEAARTLGRSPLSTFFTVALPLARPGIAAGLALVIMEVLNDYGAVHYFGVSTFTVGIFRAWLSLGDLEAAIRLSGVLMVFVLGLLTLERLQRGRARHDDGAEQYRPLARTRLRGLPARAAWTICALPVVFGFGIPVAQLVYWASRTASRVVDADFVALVTHSFGLAAASAFLCTVVGLFLAYSVRVAGERWLRSFSRLAVLGYSIPGAVVAVGVLVPFAWIDRTVDAAAEASLGVSTGLLLSGTLAALVFAYLVRFMAVALTPVESGFERVCGRLDEAARVCGASPLGALRRVALPLLHGTLVAAFMLVFVDVLKELPLALILRPFNFDTLATTAFQLAGDEQMAESANASLLIILTAIVPVVLLDRLMARDRRSVT